MPALLRLYHHRQLAVMLGLLMTLPACMQHPPSTAERELTAGVVQKEIRRGMSQADVASALGSPNIVTRDSEGRETWVYDRIATTAEYQHSSYGVGAGGAGAGAGSDSLLLGVLVGALGGSQGYTSSTQRSLTVILKFDASTNVDTFSFHQTKF